MKNKIYKGDNLEILKNIKTEYKNKVDLIYIDPPYRTNNKKLTYNDVFTKDEWKNLLKTRFIESKDFLTEKGLILVSIDEFEFANLKLLMDEIFGEENFLINFIWKKNSLKNNSLLFSNNHEYILCYSKNIEFLKNNSIRFKQKKKGYDLLKSFEEKIKNETELKTFLKENKSKLSKGLLQYKFFDEDKKKIFRISDVSAPGGNGKTFSIIHPITKKECKNPQGGWIYSEETMKHILENDLLYFGKNEKNVPQYKRYLENVEDEVVPSIIENYDEGIKDLQKILPNTKFTNPKPVSLIKFFLDIILEKDSIVLDYFAGSGTTGQAVLELNEEKKYNTAFILITNNENNICEEVTIPRIKKLYKNFNLKEETLEIKKLP